MVKISEVSKKMGNFKIDNASFELPSGYICGLVGKNAAGKTTLLHLIMGLYEPDEGDICINGLNYIDDEKKIKNMTGVVLNEELFDNEVSALDNGKKYGKFYAEYNYDLYCDYLDTFNVDKDIKLKNFSKGQKLKCQFAFALSCNPKLLILDEPTANFDLDFREIFWKTIREFVADGERNVIIATHLTDELDRMVDYIIYIEEGAIHYSGDIERFRETYRILTGEAYKIKLIDKKRLIYMEKKKYGAKALVLHKRGSLYDESLEVTYPSIEEFMYYYSKRKGGI